MFELIKKWFKRPIVINFTVEPLSSGAALNVVKTDSHLTPEVVEAFHKAWTQLCKGEAKVLCLVRGVTLEQLSDEQLKAAGLMRIESKAINITVSNLAGFNSGVAKYLKNGAERKR